MLTCQRCNYDIELFQRDDAIGFGGLGDVTREIEKQFHRRVIRQREDFIEHLARPIFMQHLFLGDEDDVAALRVAFTHEIDAFEEGGEADDVERFCWHGLRFGQSAENSFL